MRKSIKKIFAVATASLMALTVAATSVPASAATISKEAKEAAKAAFDGSGNTTYHAYIGLQQTQSWYFRDEWYSKENGLNGTKLTDGYDKMYQSKDNQNNAVEGVTITDAEIKGNGTYTVKLEGLAGKLQEAESAQQAVVSMIYVDTDIPMSATEGGVAISDWKLKIDGISKTLPETVFIPKEYTDESKLLRFDPVNTYQKEQGAYPDCPSITTPNDSIEISFKISGFDVDDPDAVEATPTPAATASSDSSSSDKSSTPIAPIVAGVVVAVVVIAGIVVVVTKKKED